MPSKELIQEKLLTILRMSLVLMLKQDSIRYCAVFATSTLGVNVTRGVEFHVPSHNLGSATKPGFPVQFDDYVTLSTTAKTRQVLRCDDINDTLQLVWLVVGFLPRRIPAVVVVDSPEERRSQSSCFLHHGGRGC